MVKKIFVRVMILGILSFFLVAIGYCQEKERPIQLTIKTDKEKYVSGEEIIFTLNFKNICSKDVWFYFGDYPGSIIDFIQIANAQGENCVFQQYVGPTFEYFAPMIEKKNYHLLKTNQEMSFAVKAKFSRRKDECLDHTNTYSKFTTCDGIFLDCGWYNIFLGESGRYNISVVYPGERVKNGVSISKSYRERGPLDEWVITLVDYDEVCTKTLVSNVVIIAVE